MNAGPPWYALQTRHTHTDRLPDSAKPLNIIYELCRSKLNQLVLHAIKIYHHQRGDSFVFSCFGERRKQMQSFIKRFDYIWINFTLGIFTVNGWIELCSTRFSWQWTSSGPLGRPNNSQHHSENNSIIDDCVDRTIGHRQHIEEEKLC